ncbi:MAG: UbiA family prenyltransferase [candidate division Zixibacteria bacterium]|nr:UbiA family prenyltransferase [candidate division Zixibacteria bacterium]
MISSITVWISFMIAGGNYNETIGIIASIAAFFFAGFANTVNDIADIEIDKINRPSRPLPAEFLSRKQAVVEAIILCVIALGFSLVLGTGTIIVALIALPGMVAYSLWLKRTVLFGNILVSFIAALAFIYGGAAFGKITPVVFPAVMAFLLHLAREIIKDIEDVRGDKKLGAQTLPIVKGERISRLTAAAILLVLVITTILPLLSGFYRLAYFLLIIPVDLIVIAIIYELIFVKDINAGRLSLYLKIAMPLGINAVFFGAIGY